jgi:hypothetical protein
VRASNSVESPPRRTGPKGRAAESDFRCLFHAPSGALIAGQQTIRYRPLTDTESRPEERCGSGSNSESSISRPRNWCNPANPSSISDSTPVARANRQSVDRWVRSPSNAVLSTPGSPRTTSALLSPERTSFRGGSRLARTSLLWAPVSLLHAASSLALLVKVPDAAFLAAKTCYSSSLTLVEIVLSSRWFRLSVHRHDTEPLPVPAQ